MKIIQIGNGHVARMHRACFSERETKVAAVIDTDLAKRQQAAEEGFPVYPDIDSLPAELITRAGLWDICTPDESHFPIMRKLLEMDSKNILVEKPICQPSQISAMEKLLEDFPNAKICVEETYASSEVVRIVREQSEKCKIVRPRIWMEQSKNRMQDIINGRFIDKELGVFALEIPHSLTVVAATGEKRFPSKTRDCDVFLEAMELPSGEVLPRQGWGVISYFTEDGCEVTICSAMNGRIIHPLLEINAPLTIPFGDSTRYRVLTLEEGDNKIIGQFEPISGFPRFRGRVLIIRNGVLENAVWTEDKPMARQIARAIRYFRGEAENPAPPLEALSIVSFLSKCVEKL